MDRDLSTDNLFNLKADIASSENVNNALFVEFFRDIANHLNVPASDDLDTAQYAVRAARRAEVIRRTINQRAKDAEIEPTPELDEFLDGFKVTTRQEVY